MELGNEMTAVIFRQELLIGKGRKFMFQVVLLVNMWIVLYVHMQCKYCSGSARGTNEEIQYLNIGEMLQGQ